MAGKTHLFKRMTEDQMLCMVKAVHRAASYCEGWTNLVQRLNEHTGEPITLQAVFKWGTVGIPAERAVDVERALGGAVLRQELRPDLYEGMHTDKPA